MPVYGRLVFDGASVPGAQRGPELVARKGRRPRLPGVHIVRSKGREYHYSHRGGVRLPDPDRDPQGYVEAYRDAHAAGRSSSTVPTKQSQTVADLVVLYKASTDFGRLAPSTQKLYSGALNAVDEHFGRLPVVALKSEKMAAVIRKWRDEIADRPRAADTRIEVLSAALQWCVRYGHISRNPAHGIEALHRSDRADLIWSPAELSRLVAAATPECARAITVAAATGLRMGDLISLRWSEIDFDVGMIEKATAKSRGRTRATPPLLPEARKALETAPRASDFALTSGLGRPWTQSGLGNAFRAARDRIGVDRRFHDLRGSAATRFALAGFSAAEVAAFMGWEERRVEAILKRYVSRRKIAEDAARRLRLLDRNDEP